MEDTKQVSETEEKTSRVGVTADACKGKETWSGGPNVNKVARKKTKSAL